MQSTGEWSGSVRLSQSSFISSRNRIKSPTVSTLMPFSSTAMTSSTKSSESIPNISAKVSSHSFNLSVLVEAPDERAENCRPTNGEAARFAGGGSIPRQISRAFVDSVLWYISGTVTSSDCGAGTCSLQKSCDKQKSLPVLMKPNALVVD